MKSYRTFTTFLAALSACSFAQQAHAQAAAPMPDPEADVAPADAAPARGGAAGARGGAPAAGRGGGGGGAQLTDAINATADFSKKEPVLPLTPSEEVKRFILQPGYKMELVLSDPDIQQPTAIAFDGNGRMFVLEERGYMLDADAGHERDPISRISLHQDKNNDGIYETHTVFVDNLIFPRFVMPFGANAILTMETDRDDVWKYTDTDGDGVADKKEFFASGFGRGGNVEHQQSFLTWTMDNWMYSTYNAFRARWTPDGIIKEPTGTNGAAWGVTQDNDGKQWFQGGASGMPGYFQFPVVYGNFTVPDQFAPELNIPWGAPVRTADMQGGMGYVRMPDGSLSRATAGAGNDIVRAHRMPADLQGELLYGEVVARIVRRLHPKVTDGVTQLSNAYLWDEFIKSRDPYFRPVDTVNAPDGSLYVTDMYHGIIQEAQWTPPGSYLRARIEQHDLDKVVGLGRIWRLTYEGLDRDKIQPHMLDETAAQLVKHLDHPNGWWRDTAQQLLILKQDKSVVPQLKALALNPKEDLYGRFHSLWTLEGLNALDPATVRAVMKDPNPRLRSQGIRASETLYKAGNKTFAADYATMAKDPDVSVTLQALMTMNTLKVPNVESIVKTTQSDNKARGVQIVSNTILQQLSGAGRGGAGLSAADSASYERGKVTYNSLCFSCHGDDGRGTPRPDSPPGITMAPPLAGSPRVNGHRDYAVNVVIHGLNGPVGGATYSEIMIPMGESKDDWIADVATYVRNSFGNQAPAISTADVARARAASADRKTPWTVADLEARLPHILPSTTFKLTASNNSAAASNATGFTAWTTGAPQQSGMWFQIELPAPEVLAELQFTSGGAAGGGGAGRAGAAGAGRAGAAGAGRAGAGGGGRGARGAAAAAAPADATAAVTAPAAQPAVATLTTSAAAQPAAANPGGRGGGAGGGGGGSFPHSYRVEVSSNGTTWTPVAEGQGVDGLNTVVFTKTSAARFVRITQTDSPQNAPSWSMTNLRVYAAGK